MADYFTSTSFVLAGFDSARLALLDHIGYYTYENDTLPQYVRDHAEKIGEDVSDEYGLGVDYESQGDGTVWCYEETQFQPSPALAALHYVLHGAVQDHEGKPLPAQTDAAKEPQRVTWANTCSKPRIGAFSGGACTIYPDRLEWDV